MLGAVPQPPRRLVGIAVVGPQGQEIDVVETVVIGVSGQLEADVLEQAAVELKVVALLHKGDVEGDAPIDLVTLKILQHVGHELFQMVRPVAVRHHDG
jgi:hypothetical protein